MTSTQSVKQATDRDSPSDDRIQFARSLARRSLMHGQCGTKAIRPEGDQSNIRLAVARKRKLRARKVWQPSRNPRLCACKCLTQTNGRTSLYQHTNSISSCGHCTKIFLEIEHALYAITHTFGQTVSGESSVVHDRQVLYSMRTKHAEDDGIK